MTGIPVKYSFPKRCNVAKALQSYVREGRKNKGNWKCEYLAVSPQIFKN